MRYQKIKDIVNKPISTSDAIDLLLRDIDINGNYLTDIKELNLYQSSKTKLCQHPALLLDANVEVTHQTLTNIWYMPDKYKDIDVRAYVLGRCEHDFETERVLIELQMFEDRDLFDLLQFLIFLVDYFRKNQYVWGVGRGSSVASYVLYLIGIHKIDSIRYRLDIGEFLKD